MKVLALGLQTSLTGSYDQTKTTLQGRAALRTINDGNGVKSVLGPSPVVTADVFDDTGVAPVGLHTSTVNGRIFIGKGFAAGVWTISMYTIDFITGARVWAGDLKLTHTNTGAYTLRGFKVDDTNPASMNFYWVTTNTTVQQGGFYACFGINVTDFVTVSVQTFPVATLGSTTKTIYQIGDQAAQAAHTVTVSDGIAIDNSGGFVYILNGVAATPKIFKFVNTVPTAAPVAGYSIANGSIVVTGTLAPALSGTILLVNCVNHAPSIGHGPNSGNAVLTWLTTTTIYNAKTSDITNGATSLPSLASANMAGSADFVTPTASFGQYSPTLDKFIIMGSIGQVIVKQGISNDPNSKIFGLNSFIKSETGGSISPSTFGAVTNLCLTSSGGWAIMTNTSVGQRNFVALDLFSDESSLTSGEINTSIISPVLTANITKATIMGIYYELAKRSVKATLQYRTSNFSVGPGAGFDATWTTATKDGDLSNLVNATQAQFRFLFTMMGMEVTNPPLINEAYLVYTDQNEISANWQGSVDNTSNSGANPVFSAFRLKVAYPTSVPTLFFRAYDDSNNLVASANTVSNPTFFEYSTNNGTSWNPLGTIPNTILTTEVRYKWASPPGVRVTASLRET